MDLNVMMREQALNGLNTQLDTAVTNGDSEAARKIAGQIAQLTAATAPKAPPYGDAEIRAELEKAEWFGIDPKKSKAAVEFGKTMDPKKFGTAADFATALIKAVEEEFKPAAKTTTEDPPENETDEQREAREAEEAAAAEEAGKGKAAAKRATDGPEDITIRGRTSARSGPWTKLSDAPADVQKEVKRAADKFVPSTATKEQREGYITSALASHYAAQQRAKGKK